MGSKIGKNIYIEETLGIGKTQEYFHKEGRYWVGITSWTDTRDGKNKKYQLVTKRSASGVLTTFLNNQAIVNHEIPNANQELVPKHHQSARNSLFDNLKENFIDKVG